MRWKIMVGLNLFFISIFAMTFLDVQASTLDRWDLTKEYTLEKGSVKYYAYLSKDKKESWIYKAELLDKSKMLDIAFPKKMEGVPVTCLGFTHDLYDKVDEELNKWSGYYNLFSAFWEPYYDHGKRPDPLIVNVRSVVLPDTVKEMGSAAFACMINLRYVHLPKGIQFLNNFMFYGCRDLQKVDFPSKIEVPVNSNALLFCDGLKGLMEEVEFRREGMTIISKGGLLINQSEKTLIQVMPTATKVTIPADIKGMEPSAFTNSSLKKVKVAKKNKYFAVHKRCLYRKKTGKLILAFGKGSTLTLSGKVRKIDKSAMVTKYKIKKLFLPNKVKRVGGWKKIFAANNKRIKIYDRGKRIR